MLRWCGTIVGGSICLVLAVGPAGCQNAGQGALSGAAVGSLSGLAIGSLSGDAGKGAAIGAIVGGVGGAIIGDQNRRKAEQGTAPSQSGTPAYAVAPALDRFVGRWDMTGWLLGAGGEKVDLSGTATGAVDKNFFLRLDLLVKDPRSGQTIEGTSVISQDGGRRVTVVNSFSTSPEMKRFEGELDESGTILTVRQVAPPTSTERRLVLRSTSADRWTAEGWERRSGQDQQTEVTTFTRGR